MHTYREETQDNASPQLLAQEGRVDLQWCLRPLCAAGLQPVSHMLADLLRALFSHQDTPCQGSPVSHVTFACLILQDIQHNH